MAGFKDFNLPVTSKPVKTLSSSLDEDDWITDADPETASQADANQHKAPEQPSQPAPQKPARIPASTPFAVPAAQLPKNDVQPVRRYVTSLPSSQMPRPVPTAAAPKQAFGGSTEKLAKGRLASFENLSEQPRMASQETLRAQAAVKGRVAVEKSATTIDSVMLAARYPAFTAPEIAAFHQQFQSIDSDSKEQLHQSELTQLATKAGLGPSELINKLNQLNLGGVNVTFEAFLKAASAIKSEKGGHASERDDKKIVLHGHMENTTHTINVDEKESFTIHINQNIGADKDIGNRFPFDPKSMQLFSECKDGMVLAKLINNSVPGTIDERVLNTGKKLNPFQMTENNNLVVNSCKAIGCSVVNIGSQDLIQGREHLILGLVWQIIKIGLSNYVDIKAHPELFRLLEAGETLEQFMKLGAEQILLRWINYHLKKASYPKTIKNFASDIRDCEAYVLLLNQLAPSMCSKAPLSTSDLSQRAEQTLANADKIGCRKYLTPKTLVEGNAKLNFCFVANLFNLYPGLEKLSDAEMASLDEALFANQGDREARQYCLWLNSLGVDPFVNNLFDDLTDGLILLQAIDKVSPGIVDWKKTNKAPVSSKFKKVENCNYTLILGKSLKFSLVGIGGSDIHDANKTLTLGFVWQLMREHVIQTLKTLSNNGKDITDQDMIQWANQSVISTGKATKMANFRDSSLATSHFFLDLLASIKPGIVNPDLVQAGGNDEEKKMNAKYAISIARKLGATIFLAPEDILEVKPKMILTFVGALMAVAKTI